MIAQKRKETIFNEFTTYDTKLQITRWTTLIQSNIKRGFFVNPWLSTFVDLLLAYRNAIKTWKNYKTKNNLKRKTTTSHFFVLSHRLEPLTIAFFNKRFSSSIKLITAPWHRRRQVILCSVLKRIRFLQNRLFYLAGISKSKSERVRSPVMTSQRRWLPFRYQLPRIL